MNSILSFLWKMVSFVNLKFEVIILGFFAFSILSAFASVLYWCYFCQRRSFAFDSMHERINTFKNARVQYIVSIFVVIGTITFIFGFSHKYWGLFNLEKYFNDISNSIFKLNRLSLNITGSVRQLSESDSDFESNMLSTEKNCPFPSSFYNLTNEISSNIDQISVVFSNPLPRIDYFHRILSAIQLEPILKFGSIFLGVITTFPGWFALFFSWKHKQRGHFWGTFAIITHAFLVVIAGVIASVCILSVVSTAHFCREPSESISHHLSSRNLTNYLLDCHGARPAEVSDFLFAHEQIPPNF